LLREREGRRGGASTYIFEDKSLKQNRFKDKTRRGSKGFK